jgi:hypothetical protein
MTESKLGELSVIYVNVDEIDPHPDNANKGDLDAIKESIRVNGYYAPIVVQSSTGYILAGNHRYRAAKDLGHAAVPVIYLDVDDEAAKRIMFADNRTTRLGHDDDALLAALLEEIGDSDTGLLGTGYTHADLQTLLDAQDKFNEEFEYEPTPEKHAVSEGVYQIEPIAGAGGKCTGVLVTRFDHEAWSPEDYNKVRTLLGLGAAHRGALATLGIEDWA